MPEDKIEANEFLVNLRKQLDKALGVTEPPTPTPDPVAPAPVADATADVVTARLDTIEKNITALSGDESPLVKALAAHAETLEKMLDRLEAVEKGTAVRKSLDADADGDADTGTPEEKGMRQLSKAIRAVGAKPGSGVRLT